MSRPIRTRPTRGFWCVTPRCMARAALPARTSLRARAYPSTSVTVFPGRKPMPVTRAMTSTTTIPSCSSSTARPSSTVAWVATTPVTSTIPVQKTASQPWKRVGSLSMPSRTSRRAKSSATITRSAVTRMIRPMSMRSMPAAAARPIAAAPCCGRPSAPSRARRKR